MAKGVTKITRKVKRGRGRPKGRPYKKKNVMVPLTIDQKWKRYARKKKTTANKLYAALIEREATRLGL